MVNYTDDKLDYERILYVEKFITKNISTILDLGCGGGKYSIYFAGKGYNITAVDYDDKVLSVLKDKIKKNNIRNIIVKKINLENKDKITNELKNKSYDAVFLFDILEHLENDIQLLQAIKKNIKKYLFINIPLEAQKELINSGFVFSTYADLTHKRYYNKSIFLDLISKCKLTLIEMKEINNIFPQSFISCVLDKSHFPTKIIANLFYGRMRILKYKNIPSSLIAVLQNMD